MKHGSWWAIQWGWHLVFSLGIHVEVRSRVTSATHKRYGPYVDIHLPGVILSLGVNPIYAGETDLKVSYSRGGISN